MQRRVAIKRMPLPVDAFGRALSDTSALAEARTAAMLNHPSIVTVFDFETDSNEAFLIMEHADGASLERILDDMGDALNLDEAAAVLDAVADALNFAHDNGVLHLDIKPANILVMHDGRVKVTDFGMAALSTAFGHTTCLGGTIGYMPLEQLEGQRVSVTTDEWALAALMYECLTSENPFDDDTIEGAIVRLGTLDTPRPRAFVPALPRAVDDVLLAALGLRPADRYPTVEAFAEALAPHLGEPDIGRTSLAELVEAYTVDDVDEEYAPGFDELGLWDRLGGPAGSVLLRIVASAESGWLTWAGLAGAHLDRFGVLGAAALVAFAGALAPSLGTGLGMMAFAIGMIVSGAWVLGVAVLLLGGAWWWLFARRSPGAAVIPLAAPALGVLWAAPATPLLAGFSLAPLPAAAAGLVGGVLSTLASAASFVSPPFASVDSRVFTDLERAGLVASSVREAFLNPTTYIVILGWVLAAVVMSLFSGRATRLGAMLGAIFGGGIIGGSYALADQASVALGNGSVWVSTQLAISLAASLTMVILVAALGAPVRPEEDDGPE